MNRILFTVKNIKFVPTKINKEKYKINMRQIQNQSQNNYNRVIKRNMSLMPNQILLIQNGLFLLEYLLQVSY